MYIMDENTNKDAGVEPVVEETPATDTVAEDVSPAEETLPETVEEALAGSDTTPSEVEEVPADDVALRDPSVAVEADEELSQAEVKDRVNYLVEHPDERTAHDPVSADGDRV